MAMTRLLDDHKISYNAPIIDHLPTFWKKGPNIDKITFRNLLTHTSGFVTQNGKTDFETMKAVVELIGVSTDPAAKYHLGKYQYENMNFGLCRILIPIINGNIDKNALISDSAWDLATILGYGTYTAVKVLAPAGVTQATFDHPAGGALAYSLVPIAKGWNSGYLGTVSGAAGWHLSANELLRVMGTFRRKGTILSPTGAQQMLDNSFGIDVIQSTPAGTLYSKNGRWQDGSFRTEQAVAYFLPEDMEMTVMVNSLVGVTQKSLSKLVTNLYLANLK
jgi:CubicO group peptidase (beta-lactamase class C family)